MEFFVLGLGVVFIIVSIAVFKLHPFLALLLAAFLVGFLSPNPVDFRERLQLERRQLEDRLVKGSITAEEFRAALENLETKVQKEVESSSKPGTKALTALDYSTREFGSTAASIGIVIVLAAIIGQCLMDSGAADKITRKLLQILGQERAPFALLGSGYFLSIPVFFDTVFFLLIPLARALRMRTKKNYVVYVMAIAGGAVISHSLVPPTPGPLIMVENLSVFGLNIGAALLIGFLLGLLPAGLGLLYSQLVNRRLQIPLREAPGSSRRELEKIVEKSSADLPAFHFSVLPVVAPVLLIAGNTLLKTLQIEGIVGLPDWILGWADFAGDKNVALLIGAFCAIALLKKQSGYGLAQLRDRLEPAVMSAGVIILITSAGGAFGKMLSRVGIAGALESATGSDQLSGIALILLAWGLSSMMKIAQGSGTVAMITASAMITSFLGAGASLPYHPIYLYAAIGFGSLFISWMNDSAFWVICKMSGFTERETLVTWTSLMAILGVTGLIEVLLASILFPFAL